MIINWTIKNFKSISSKITLEFAPLTIFAGANSSGKSTVIQSILMAAQTIQNYVKTKSVILNGHIVKLGTFSDVLSNRAEEELISIGFSIVPHEDSSQDFDRFYVTRGGKMNKLDCFFSFSTRGEQKEKDILQLQPRLEESIVKSHYSFDQSRSKKDYDSEIHVVRSRKKIEERLTELNVQKQNLTADTLNSLEYEVIKPRRSHQVKSPYRFRGRRNGDYVGTSLYHFLPSSLTLLYDRIEEQKSIILEMLSNPRQYEEFEIENKFMAYINPNIERLLLELLIDIKDEAKVEARLGEHFTKAYEKLREEFSLKNLRKCYSVPVFNRLIAQKIEENEGKIKSLIDLGNAKEFTLDSESFYPMEYINYLDHFFKRSLKYLGPLRDEPKPVYPLQGTADPRDIGYKGENTASVLDINRNADVEYFKPQSIGSNQIRPEKSKSTLYNAVLDWLKYMGVAEGVQTSDKGKLGHEMKIMAQGSSSLHDLTHVGVGVSQVLPILVLSLLAEKDSTLIFEQPELHLHPMVQTRLADFFASMVLLEKQCIVETHSEYLINRLRFLSAISKENEISSKVSIFFVEKENDISIYNKIKFNKYGSITNWPKGFFDENEKNAASIIKAAMNKKSNEKHQG